MGDGEGVGRAIGSHCDLWCGGICLGKVKRRLVHASNGSEEVVVERKRGRGRDREASKVGKGGLKLEKNLGEHRRSKM